MRVRRDLCFVEFGMISCFRCDFVATQRFRHEFVGISLRFSFDFRCDFVASSILFRCDSFFVDFGVIS